MRRDYFTCVFLGLIAGALTFVCFRPLYFTWDQIIPRDFSLLERIASLIYALFFVIFLPCFAAFKKKEWINWGLAIYGLMAYLPLWFYPDYQLITGEQASMLPMLGALCLRTVYAVMQAPFAALSTFIGNDAASMIVYWILPVSVIWPLLFRIIRFYRRAYLSEQLNPMTPDQAAPAASKAPEAPEKPEVLGTVISAPVTTQTPVDITRKNIPTGKTDEIHEPPKAEAGEKAAIKEGHMPRRTGVRAPVRPVHVGVAAPKKDKVESLGSGPVHKEPESSKVIQMGAPKPKPDEAIPMPPPKPKPDEAIPLGAPSKKTAAADPGAGKPVHLGAPPSGAAGKSGNDPLG